MVDRGNTDKHRTGITGNGLKGLSKVVETEKWGIDTATRAVRQNWTPRRRRPKDTCPAAVSDRPDPRDLAGISLTAG